MSRVNIQLAPKVLASAESRAAQKNATLDDYLESLIVADSVDESYAPEYLRVTSTDQLTVLLREGEASALGEMTASDWSEIRQRISDRSAASGNR